MKMSSGKKNIYIVYLITIIKEDIKLKEKFEINSQKIKTIKELKYYIIDKFKKENYCPCLLIISEFLKYGLFYSELNDKPNKDIEGSFKDNKIFHFFFFFRFKFFLIIYFFIIYIIY